MFFSLTIFGYFNNCTFLSNKGRISGIQQYITYLLFFVLLSYFIGRKDKYKVKKEKLNFKKDINFTFATITICLILTLVCTFLE